MTKSTTKSSSSAASKPAPRPSKPQDPERDGREARLLTSLDNDNKSYIFRRDLEEAIAREGLSLDDYRLHETRRVLAGIGPDDKIDYRSFCEIIRPSILLAERALQGNMVIRDFDEFCRDISGIYAATLPNRSGAVADYIPQLARVNPEQFAVSLCTVDGQRLSLGDSKVDFSVQSTTCLLYTSDAADE